MWKASAFVPGHISGFFQVHTEFEDPARKGSRNCGLCIDTGVTTDVKVKDDSSNKLKISIDGQESRAETTRTAAGEILETFERTASVEVDHSVQAPIGAGYGVSGAGALGAVLALSRALDLGFDREEILKIAHKAEVLCRSGLGDVGPQMLGGAVIGLEPGSPPHGEWEKIDIREDLSVVCGTLGPLSTPDLLADSSFGEKTKELGESAMNDLLSDKNLDNFLKISQRFTAGLGIYDDEFLKILEEISSRSPLGASAVMLGRAIFAPGPKSKIEELENLFLNYFDSEDVLVTSVDFEGAKILG